MKKLLLFTIALFITAGLMAQALDGTWKVANEAGAIGVGPNQGDISWWSIDEAGLTVRACYFDDEYQFGEDGSFKNVMGGETWVEEWQGVDPPGCAAPVAPHDGSNPATWEWDDAAGELTLNGVGAFLGLAKVYNGGELTSPDDAPESITYMVEFTNDDTRMTVDISIGGGWWRFVLVKMIFEPINVTMNVDMSGLEGFDPETHSVYVSGSIFGWPEPGTNEDLKLSQVEETLVYTITAEMEEAGEIQYKYFSDAVAEGWDGGEWGGDPNRKVFVVGEATLNDTWGDQPFPVTFNVDMSQAEEFNPDTDEVFMAGTVNVANVWQQPGTDPSLKLTAGDDMVYSVTLMLYAGDYEYKYFRVINGEPSWDNGEWDGGDNRMITVTEERTINDVWGVETMPGARVQVIHNSADAAAAVVDVWLNDAKLIEDFAFRTASPFIDGPVGEPFTISIKGPGSTLEDEPVWSNEYTLEDGKTYILIANGIVSGDGYDPVEPFNIYVYDMAREASGSEETVDVLVFHGATDAPTVSIYEASDDPFELVPAASYGDFAGYLELAVQDYTIQIRNEAGDAEVATYAAPLATLGLDGAAITVVASGFLAPANNSDGPLFALYAASAAGGALLELPFLSSIDEISSSTPAMNIYPNPAQNFLNIELLEATSKVEVFNVVGKNVMTIDQVNSEVITINTSSLSNGVYFIAVHTESGIQTTKFIKN